ncbi:FtsQ-type POTRA domain-containing protein [Streptococcus phocae subsp. salmonis]
MTKKKKTETTATLTEWQKRNIAFLKKKQQELAEEKKRSEALRKQKKAQLQLDTKSDEPTTKTESKTTPAHKKLTLKKPKQKKGKTPRQKAFRKAAPVLLGALLVMAASIFMITPYSKLKVFSVTGNKHISLEEVVKSSKVKASDYWLTLWAMPKHYEEALVQSNVWVKQAKLHYQFPNQFLFDVTEHRIIAYAQTAEGFQPILENGKRVEVVSESDLPKSFLIVNLEDEHAVQHLVKSLAKLSKSLIKNIKSVSLANSKTTKDLLLIELHDGNLIRVPQSQIEKKLPYYQKLKMHLAEPSIVDMEVGLYTTTEEIESRPAKPVTPEPKANEQKPQEGVPAEGDANPQEQSQEPQPGPREAPPQSPQAPVGETPAE